jgi:hypothetical protein
VSLLMQILLTGQKIMSEDSDNKDDSEEFNKWLEDWLDANYDELYEKFQWDKQDGLL